jgi:hypothetical protein
VGNIVTLLSVPNELQLEILQQMDVPSIFIMRAVNRHFHQLIHSNEETIVRGTLTNAECIGPHAILLQFYPFSANPYYCTLDHAKRIHTIKHRILRVAQICKITTKAKIDALYCVRDICKRARKSLPRNLVERQELSHNPEQMVRLRLDLQSPYTTEQLQNMLPVCFRLVFGLAYQLGEDYRGSYLGIENYTKYNSYLIINGPEVIATLEESINGKLNAAVASPLLIEDEYPWMHDELIGFLEYRGPGLMTDPGIEITQFFEEEDTYLDMRRVGIEE